MTAVLLGAALFLILMGAGFCLLLARLISRQRSASASDDYEQLIFCPARYKAMERLLEESDCEYVAAKTGNSTRLERRFRAQRVRIFRDYVNCLAEDFSRICAAIKKYIVESGEDRPDLAGLLMKQNFTFTLTVLGVEFRLILYGLGVGQPDGRDLVLALEEMCSSLQALALVVNPA